MRGYLLHSVVLALAFSMTPGAFEVAENVVHVAAHGDVAHARSGGHSRRTPADEHGCSGAVHACGCCHSLQFVPTGSAPVESAARVSRVVATPVITALPNAPASRVFRPPRG